MDKPDVILKTEDVDREVGEEVSQEVAAELGLVDASELSSHVNALGNRLVLHAPRRKFDYAFRIVDQDMPNAFALPGGFIFVSRGLLTLTNSEDELANVLCHEIIHVANRHAAGRQEVERTTVNPLMLPGVLLGSVLGESAGRAISQPFSIFSAGYIAKYSREQEREADRAGQALCAKVGFDPGGMASFLRSLERTERLEQGFSRIPGFLSTHPSTPERVGAAATRGQTLVWSRGPGISSERAVYLQRLDGLFVGVSPAEGVFDGERFLHADLGFAMRFPSGWHLLNTRRAVGASSPKRDAEVFLEASGEGDDPEAAAQEFLEQEKSGLHVQHSETLRVSGLPAYRVSAKTSLTKGHANVDLIFIAYGGLVYRITGIWPTGAPRYRGIIQGVARSFRPLGREERLTIRGNRLRLARAREGSMIEHDPGAPR